jgi:hypothetical protein
MLGILTARYLGWRGLRTNGTDGLHLLKKKLKSESPQFLEEWIKTNHINVSGQVPSL